MADKEQSEVSRRRRFSGCPDDVKIDTPINDTVDVDIVDDLITEFLPDETDRKMRRRSQPKNRRLGLGFNSHKVDRPAVCQSSRQVPVIDSDSSSIDVPPVEREKVLDFSTTVELQEMGEVGNGNEDVTARVDTNCCLDSDKNLNLVLNPDGSLCFYILDAQICDSNSSILYLFGKVKAGNSYHSCCVTVKNMRRCVYAIPNESVFDNEVVLKLKEEFADSEIAFRSKLLETAPGLKREISKRLVDLNVSSFSMVPVKRNYAFERFDIPSGENYVLKINYPFKDPPLPSDLKGRNFSAMLGTHTSSLELFLVKRKIKGPSWLSISKFSQRPSGQEVSWCKFEITVDSPKNVTTTSTSSSNHNTATYTDEIPPLIVTAISLKTINEQHNINEIVLASIVSCNKTKIDPPKTPMLDSEWEVPGVWSHFTVVRKLNDEGIFPEGFTEAKPEAIVESIEEALLNCLITHIYTLDSDVLVGHNISRFDLDVLLRRAKALKLPSKIWSKIGRLKSPTMPNLTRRSTIFGHGASPGMSCIAGRLLCDTYLCSRDLLKEVNYTLTQLAKTQLTKERKEIALQDIRGMYHSKESLINLVNYNVTDARMSMELMFHLSILPLTHQLSNISGNLWGKTLQGGRAHLVEYLLLHAFHKEKYIVPDKYSSHGKENKLVKRKRNHGYNIDIDDLNIENETLNNVKGKKGHAYVGGLVLEPKKGLYDNYVVLLDFNSLYPSVIQEYNICFTTVGRYPDGSAPRLPSCREPGVLPKLLKMLVERRKSAKVELGKSKGPEEKRKWDIRQQALKLTANSVYGCLGFPNSRFYAKPLAELITQQGREILQNTVDLVENVVNLEVIYGDTDSIMIYTGHDIKEAKDVAWEVIRKVNKKYTCLEIGLDGLYKRMLLLKKKKYAAVKMESRGDTTKEVIECKGLDMVRRDVSLLAKELGNFSLEQILSGRPCDDVVGSIHKKLMEVQEQMRNGKIALEKYIITKTLTKAPEAYPDAKNQPHVQVALRLKRNGYFSGCSAGDTVSYIICCEEGGSSMTSTGVAQQARHPDELKRENSKWIVDIDYYLSHQIHPVVSRLCAFIQGTSPTRLADCLGLDPSKFQTKSMDTTSNYLSTLCSVDDEERYQGCEPLVLSCPSCSSTFYCPSIYSSLCKSFSEMQPWESNSNIWRRLCCPKCPEEGNVGRISSTMIANQVKRQSDKFILMYYCGLMMCDDEACKYSTRSLNLRVIGDSERGTCCPNYAHCNGRLVRKYTEADLYKQLTYFCHILDTVDCIDKIKDLKGNARSKLIKELDKVRLAADTAQKLRDRCGYGCVTVNFLNQFSFI